MHGPQSFGEWRELARAHLAAGRAPDEVCWSDGQSQGALPMARAGAPARALELERGAARVPRELLTLLQAMAQHRDARRWDLMYRLLWRVQHGGRGTLDDGADPLVRQARQMEREVRRDLHKLHAFVRFRELPPATTGAAARFVAWFEPEHHILREGAGFFVRRFPNMAWTLVTPEGAAAWDGEALRFVAAPSRDALPREDAHEELWRTYYRSICNLARISPDAMTREMPRRYWKNLPEAAEIAPLLREAPRRVGEFDDPARRMRHAPLRSAGPAPRTGPGDLPALLEACRRCPLWEHATQAVAGEGPPQARLVLVGEQPGDEEDLLGRPFVGPAGRLLDTLLEEAGIDRAAVYVTNAVKHFKWEPRGRRRLHKTPAQREVVACRPWLAAELQGLGPAVVVALGATALHSLTQRELPVGRARDEVLATPEGWRVLASWHPSALLRAEGGRAVTLREELLADLRRAADLAREPAAGEAPAG